MILANEKLVFNQRMNEQQYDEWLDIQYDLTEMVEQMEDDDFEIYIGQSRESESTYFKVVDEETGEDFEITVRNHTNKHFSGSVKKELYREIILSKQKDEKELQAIVKQTIEEAKQKLITIR
ncbi:hypothetical protein [Paraliobacillus ryukyuensis]|uniref:hypothetical protein n=1 Tax=Paraliobacillus ryukyuensis TaxID=200904 RepID=UPI0009A6954F|nr:hypothetical protein [Paraliobacillus ryukyuensis]